MLSRSREAPTTATERGASSASTETFTTEHESKNLAHARSTCFEAWEDARYAQNTQLLR
jgi:hypothetical protein